MVRLGNGLFLDVDRGLDSTRRDCDSCSPLLVENKSKLVVAKLLADMANYSKMGSSSGSNSGSNRESVILRVHHFSTLEPLLSTDDPIVQYLGRTKMASWCGRGAMNGSLEIDGSTPC